LLGAEEAALYADLTSYAFTAWRPTVGEALSQVVPRRKVTELERSTGVRLNCPPSDMPFAAWLTLTRTFRTVAGEHVAAFHGARSRLEQQQAGLKKEHRTRKG